MNCFVKQATVDEKKRKKKPNGALLQDVLV